MQPPMRSQVHSVWKRELLNTKLQYKVLCCWEGVIHFVRGNEEAITNEVIPPPPLPPPNF